MSLDKLPTRTNGDNIDETWFNRLKKILCGAFVPRDETGEVVSRSTDLGSATYRWKRVHVAAGYLFPGAIKAKYMYSGAGIAKDRGWMLMDGRIINETNYNTEHGAGSWDADGMDDSPLVGKYLPNCDDRFLRGITGDSGSTQDGSAPITFSGTGTISVAHTHGSGSFTTTDVNSKILGGTKLDVDLAVNNHTHTVSIAADTTTGDCRPSAVAMNFFMRVI